MPKMFSLGTTLSQGDNLDLIPPPDWMGEKAMSSCKMKARSGIQIADGG
jgi:hypothetical protein